MSYEYLIEPIQIQSYSKNIFNREDLLKQQNEFTQTHEEIDDLSDKEEFKYVKTAYKRGTYYNSTSRV